MVKNKHALLIPLLMLLIIILSVLFRMRIHSAVAAIPDYMDEETGVPYLTEMDSYYHLRMTENICELGHPGNSLKDGKPWDSLSYAPDGRDAAGYRPLMAYIAITVYKAASLFSPVTLPQVVYWLNMFISALVVIPVFLLTYEMCGLIGASVAAVLSTLNYGYLIHTTPGFFDTDGVITWVSCFFLYFACMVIKKWREKDKKAACLFGAGLLISFSALYNSWYIYYMFPALMVLSLIIYGLLTYEKGSPRSVYLPAIFSLILGVLVLVLEPGLFNRIFSMFGNIFTKGNGLFPNIFVSIAEMRKPALWTGALTGFFQMKVLSETNIGIINAVGGIVPFLAAFAMFVIFIRRIIKKDVRLEYILLIIWYAVTLVLSFRGWRFIMLFSIPVGILAGNLTGFICYLMDNGKMMDRNVYKAMLTILMLFPAIYGAFMSSGDSRPSGYSELGLTLKAIREQTPEDTVLVSWWDYGYIFEEKTGRKTLFDGGSQSGIRSYWVAKALATTKEQLSFNIIRMLTGSGDRACEGMLETFGETKDTLLFMDELLSGDRESAQSSLKSKDITPEKAEELLSLMFPENLPETDFIITPDMSGISGWFAEFGLKDRSDDPVNTPFQTVANMISVSRPMEGDNVYSIGNGCYVVLKKSGNKYSACTSYAEGWSDAQPLPVKNVIVMDDSSCTLYEMKPETAAVNEAESGEAASGVSGTVSNEDGSPLWTVIITDLGEGAKLSLLSDDLAGSVFGRMFYLYGYGLEHYEYDYDLSGIVRVFKVR